MFRFLIISLIFFVNFLRIECAVIGIDLGSEFVKVAMVKPGQGFDIVPDEQSRRKFPALVTFDENGERLFGNGATALALKRPASSYLFTSWLLGKPFLFEEKQGLAGKRFESAFLPNKLVQTERNSVAFQHNATDVLNVEVVAGMILGHAKAISTAFAGAPVKDCVITVPAYYNVKERQSLLDAAELAGLNVLTLMNDNTAFGLQYAINYPFEVNKSTNVVIYNMGSSSTQATLFKFSASKGSDGKVNGNVEVLNTAWDATLGGLSFDLLLAEEFLNRFIPILSKKKVTATKEELIKNPRVMARLRDTANRIKEILSANKEAPVYTESLFKDIDFVSNINQEEFMKLAEPLLARVLKPLEELFAGNPVETSKIDHFVLVGGGTRIPRIQQMIKTFLKRESLDQNLNGDEAAAFGAAFRAANLSLAFRVRQIGLTDITRQPIGVRFHNLDENQETFAKRASLFSSLNPIDRRKVVSFPTSVDLTANVFYDVADKGGLEAETPIAIANYSVTGISDAAEKHAALLKETNEKPKVSFSFVYSPSGVMELVSAEATIEELVKVPVPVVKASSNSTTNATKSEEGKSTTDAEGKSDTKEEKTEESAEKKEEAKPEEPKFTTKKKNHRYTLKVSRTDLLNTFTSKDKSSGLETLRLLAAFDFARRELADSHNALESFLYSVRDKLAACEYDEESDVALVTNAKQRSSMQSLMDVASAWLNDHGVGTETVAADYKEELSKVKSEWILIQDRVKQLHDRPDAVAAARSVLNATKVMSVALRKEKPWLNATEFEKLDSLIATAEKWLNESVATQEKTPLSDPPVFLASDIPPRMKPCRDFALQLSRRVKPVPPKPKAAKKGKGKPKSETKTDSSDKTPSEESKAEEKEEVETEEKSNESSSESNADAKEDETTTEAPKESETKEDL